jgi:hypothetical protein
VATPDVVERCALRDLVEDYAAAADQRDTAMFTGLFLADATLSIHRQDGVPVLYTGLDRLSEIPERLARYRQTLHLVGNHRVTIDGDTAHGEATCQAHHLSDHEDGITDLVLTIRYQDVYARTPVGWRFATRQVHILWQSEGPVTNVLTDDT